MPSRVPLIYGTGGFGRPGIPGVRVTDTRSAQAIFDAFFGAGYDEIDTARMYGAGTTEELLAACNLKNSKIDTKILPGSGGGHAAGPLRAKLEESLAFFTPRGIKIRTLYLHRPDEATPFEETIAALDKMHKEGLFEEFGLSNYTSWQVARIYTLAQEHGWIPPTIYQGRYNPLHRSIELELIPCLRHYNIRFVMFNALAGGLLSGRYTAKEQDVEVNTRFDPNTPLGKMYRTRYFNDQNFEVLKIVKEAVDKEGITFVEALIRWLNHHSILTEKDGIVIGAQTTEQLKQQLDASEKGPLPQSVLDAMNTAHAVVAATAPVYYNN